MVDCLWVSLVCLSTETDLPTEYSFCKLANTYKFGSWWLLVQGNDMYEDCGTEQDKLSSNQLVIQPMIDNNVALP